MSLQFGNNVLDLWLGGSHQDELRVHDVEAKRKGVTDRDQVQAVVQALQRQQSRATGTIPARAEPINEVAGAFLLSGPKQDVRILSSPTPNAGPPPGAIQSARTPPTATQTARAPSNATRNTEVAPSASQRVEIKDSSRLAASDSGFSTHGYGTRSAWRAGSSAVLSSQNAGDRTPSASLRVTIGA